MILQFFFWLENKTQAHVSSQRTKKSQLQLEFGANLNSQTKHFDKGNIRRGRDDTLKVVDHFQ